MFQIFLPLLFVLSTALPFTPILPDACPAEPTEVSAAWNEDRTGAVLCAPPDYEHEPDSFVFYEDGSGVWRAYDPVTGLWMSTSACLVPEMGCSD